MALMNRSALFIYKVTLAYKYKNKNKFLKETRNTVLLGSITID